VIPLLLVVISVYQVQISKKNWSVVLGGLALWECDWFNEIWNGLVFYFTQFAPVWDAPWGDTAYLILIGLNIEIRFMFASMGVAATLALPEGWKIKILGVPKHTGFHPNYEDVICAMLYKQIEIRNGLWSSLPMRIRISS
jgi:hypothetical protein